MKQQHDNLTSHSDWATSFLVALTSGWSFRPRYVPSHFSFMLPTLGRRAPLSMLNAERIKAIEKTQNQMIASALHNEQSTWSPLQCR
eukprot:688003-Amphidinium_carterae.1